MHCGSELLIRDASIKRAVTGSFKLYGECIIDPTDTFFDEDVPEAPRKLMISSTLFFDSASYEILVVVMLAMKFICCAA